MATCDVVAQTESSIGGNYSPSRLRGKLCSQVKPLVEGCNAISRGSKLGGGVDVTQSRSVARF